MSCVPSPIQLALYMYDLRVESGHNERDPFAMTLIDTAISHHLVSSRTREHEFNCEWFAPASAGYGNLDDATFNDLMSMGIDPNDVREFHTISSSN